MADGSPLKVGSPVPLFDLEPTLPSYGEKQKEEVVETRQTQQAAATKRKAEERDDPLLDAPPQKKPKHQEPLFPDIKSTTSLPEHGSDIHFDRSFLHQKSVDQPIEPQRQVAHIQEPHRESMPPPRINALPPHFDREFSEHDQTLSEFEKKLLHSNAGSLVKIASRCMDIRLEEQKEIIQSFKSLNNKMQGLRAKKTEHLDNLANNAKLEDYWTTVNKMASYLTIGFGIALGLGTLAFGIATGNIFVVLSGLLSGLGGLGSLTSQWMVKQKYNEKYSQAVNVMSLLLVAGSSFYNFSSILNMGKMAMIKTGLQIMGVTTQSISQYQISQLNAEQYTIQAEMTRIQHHQEKNRNKLTAALSAMRLRELADEVEAASKQIAEEDKLKERIAQILSSAA